MNPLHHGLLLLMAASGLFFSGCGGGGDADAKAYRYHVVCTTGMVGDIVRNVAGEGVRVTTLMGAGVDPHLYAASLDDVAALSSADVVFYSGLMLEGKMSESLESVGVDKPAVAVTRDFPEDLTIHVAGFGGHADPHVWMDPELWSRAVDTVAEVLAKYDPPHAEQYRGNAAKYKAELAELDAYGKRVLATVPRDSRVMVTSHDAFNYFGRAFNLEVEGVQGISTESEAGLARMNQLVDMLVDRKVKAVFAETSVSAKSVESLINGARSRGREIKIGGRLFSDAMGDAGTYEGTYIGMLDHNITVVARALGGEAPEGGMRGGLKSE